MRNEIDVIDIVALVLAPIAGASILGVWSFSLDVFGGYDFGSALWTVGGAEITLWLILFLGSVVWIVGTNEIDGSDYSDLELVLIGALVLVIPLYEFVPAFASLLNFHDMMRVAASLAIGAGTVVVSYVE